MSLLDDKITDFINGPLADFGVPASFSHDGGDPSTINVVFRNDYRSVEVSDGLSIETADPAAECIPSDVSTAINGDTLVIGGVTYYVINKNITANSPSILWLSKDAPQ